MDGAIVDVGLGAQIRVDHGADVRRPVLERRRRARQRGQRRGGGAESEGFLTRELHLLDGKACGVQASVQRGGLRAFPRAVEAFDEYERAAAGSGHDGETRS